jgi:3-oxoacyl-[acyl-carrier-protein] synthase II
LERAADDDILITGVGVVSPFGVGIDALWDALVARRSGVRPIRSFDASHLPVRIAAEADDFDPRLYVEPRKSLKVMSRDMQLGVVAAKLAWADACLSSGAPDPDRIGVVFGADRMRHELSEFAPLYRASLVDGKFQLARWPTLGFKQANPLLMLKVLPNMLSSHISILQDARGPNNTVTMRELSSLLAVAEAAEILRRGTADVMITGGASSRLHPLDLARSCVAEQLSRRDGDPAAASRPFDAQRDGQVVGEGAAAFILETRRHASARSARVRGQLLGWSSTAQPESNGQRPSGLAVRRALVAALSRAGLAPSQIGHVNAHGLSTVQDDRIEASALVDVLADIPVTAPKSYFGNLGAGGGAVELAVSLLALEHGQIPPTLNYHRGDPDIPLSIVRGEPLRGRAPTCISVNHNTLGQIAAAIVLAR